MVFIVKNVQKLELLKGGRSFRMKEKVKFLLFFLSSWILTIAYLAFALYFSRHVFFFISGIHIGLMISWTMTKINTQLNKQKKSSNG